MPGSADLDEDHASAYRALVGLGGAEPAELAARLTLPEDDALRLLRRLEGHGLAVRSPARPGRWLAAGAARPGGPGAPRQRSSPGAGEPHSGRARPAAAGEEPDGQAPPGGPAVRDDHRAALHTVAADAGERLREGSGVPAGGRTTGRRAADGPDAVDLRILSLLLAGLTDASAAKQLDLGLRTVQRRVKRLMEIAGVSTRLQLGWYACERGWPARRPGTVPGPSVRGTEAGAGPAVRPADDEPLPGHPPPGAH
ncbi:hypothetical protein [Streptomyces albus]|uniref:helix-turn-helix transcriptional regulator n=1 Tax=Streptomyces albus TaxID=1888 RepID=UPI00373AEE4C